MNITVWSEGKIFIGMNKNLEWGLEWQVGVQVIETMRFANKTVTWTKTELFLATVKYITVKITCSLPCMWTDKGAEAQGPFLGSIASESGVEQSHLPQVLSLLLGGSK